MQRSDGEDDGGPVESGRGSLGRVAKLLLPGFVRRRYAVKFLLAMLVVVLLVSVVGGLSYVQIRDIIEEDAETTLRSSSTLQADSVEEWIAGMETQTAGVANAAVLGTNDSAAVREYLDASLARTSDEVVGIHLVDRESERIVASTDERFAAQPIDARSPAWGDAIDDAREGGDVGSSQTAFERRGSVLMAFAVATPDNESWVVLLGDAGRDVEQLHSTGAVARTRILTADGLDVFETRGNTPLDVADRPAFQAALEGEATVVERETDVVAFVPVDGEDWAVVTEAPKSELYAASRTVGRNVIVLVAASVGTLAIVGFLLGRGTVVPLACLRRRAREMEQGNLDVDLATDREDEIGRLFVAFANMRDALREEIETAESAREAAEESRRELERQNARLDEFASTVSHDLRNPLNVADGQLELLAMDLAEDDVDREDLTDRVETIGDAHERMESIIEDVLALARGDESIEVAEPVSLQAAAEDAWATVETAAATLDVADDRTIMADPVRFQRVLENLFHNAVEHGSTSPASHTRQDAVEHGAPDVTVTVEPSDDGFAVADDGPGIPADVLDSVFEYGVSGDEEGTGFGLSIVRTIAEAHGWSVAVDDTHDGARFVFTGVEGGANVEDGGDGGDGESGD